VVAIRARSAKANGGGPLQKAYFSRGSVLFAGRGRAVDSVLFTGYWSGVALERTAATLRAVHCDDHLSCPTRRIWERLWGGSAASVCASY
jgi:hypothetical protein